MTLTFISNPCKKKINRLKYSLYVLIYSDKKGYMF